MASKAANLNGPVPRPAQPNVTPVVSWAQITSTKASSVPATSDLPKQSAQTLSTMPTKQDPSAIIQKESPPLAPAEQAKFDPTAASFRPQQAPKEIVGVDQKAAASPAKSNELNATTGTQPKPRKKTASDKLKSAHADNEKLKFTIDQQQNQLVDLNRHLTETKVKLEKADAVVDEVKKDLTETAATLKKVTVTVDEIKTESEKKLKEADASLDQAKRTIHELNTQIKTQQNELLIAKASLVKNNQIMDKQQQSLNNRNQEAAAGRVLSVGRNGEVGLQQNIALGNKTIEKLRAQLVRAHPIADQPDDNIKDLYEKLCESITMFVEMRFRKVQDIVLKIEKLFEQLIDLGQADLEKKLPEKVLRAVERFPKSDKVVLKGFLWRLISSNMFGETSMFAEKLSSAAVGLYTTVEAMEKLAPKRDPQNIQYWRAEGFRALVESQEFLESREDAIRFVAEMVVGFCCELDPEKLDKSAIEKSIIKCLDIAAELEWALRCSTKTYVFMNPTDSSGEGLVKDITFDTLNDCNVISASTGVLVDKGDSAPDDGRIGGKIFHIYPELRVKHAGEAGSTVLSKATILAMITAETQVKDAAAEEAKDQLKEKKRSP